MLKRKNLSSLYQKNSWISCKNWNSIFRLFLINQKSRSFMWNRRIFFAFGITIKGILKDRLVFNYISICRISWARHWVIAQLLWRYNKHNTVSRRIIIAFIVTKCRSKYKMCANTYHPKSVVAWRSSLVTSFVHLFDPVFIHFNSE